MDSQSKLHYLNLSFTHNYNRVATASTVKEIEEVLTIIIHKLTKYWERQKIIVRDDDDGGFKIPIPDEDTLSKLQASIYKYFIRLTFLDKKHL